MINLTSSADTVSYRFMCIGHQFLLTWLVIHLIKSNCLKNTIVYMCINR